MYKMSEMIKKYIEELNPFKHADKLYSYGKIIFVRLNHQTYLSH
jgi:hypothetical protein